MSDQSNIPVLTDLIERGMEITMSDLGLDESAEIEIDATEVDMGVTGFEAVNPLQANPLEDNPALEQAIRQILDEHMELAWQEIRFAILQHQDK
jgi:hypothetical protein